MQFVWGGWVLCAIVSCVRLAMSFDMIVVDLAVDPYSQRRYAEGKEAGHKAARPCEVFLWGRIDSQERQSVQVVLHGYMPRTYVLLGEEGVIPEADEIRIVDELSAKLASDKAAPIESEVKSMRRTDGYHRRRGRFWELRFLNCSKRRTAVRLLKEVGWEVHETEGTIDEEIQFLVRCGIKAQGWLRIKEWTPDLPAGMHRGRTRVNAFVNGLHNIEALDRDDLGPLKALGFDIEAISRDRPRAFEGGNHVRDVKPPAVDIGRGIRLLRDVVACVAHPTVPVGEGMLPMPVPSNPKDETTAISNVVWWLDGARSEDVLRHVITQKQVGPPSADGEDPYTVESVGTERELIERWAAFVEEADPDIFFTYNGNNFDICYLTTRAAMTSPSTDALFKRAMGRAFSAEQDVKSMSTGQGQRRWFMLKHLGRVHADLYDLVQRLHGFQLRSYKLAAVAKHVLPNNHEDRKIDLPASTMFRLYEEGTPEGIRVICRYADMDAFLLKRIADTLHTAATMVMLCRVSGVPLRMKLRSGQGIMTCAQLYDYMHRYNCVMMSQPTIDSGTREEELRKAVEYEGGSGAKRKKDNSFQGGKVLAPEPGMYMYPTTSQVFVLDFAALYPSIIMGYELCFTTVIYDKDELDPDDQVLVVLPRRPAERFAPAPAPPADGLKPVLHVHRARDLPPSVPPPTEALWFKRGVDHPPLPETLRDTVATRKRVQRAGEALPEGDPNKLLMHLQQLMLKVLSNAHYGTLGMAQGKNTCRRVGVAIPLIGGWMLETVRNAAEAFWPVHIHYGDTDSVMLTFRCTHEPRCATWDDMLACGFALGETIAKSVTCLFPAPVKLEVEKAYEPYVIADKKKRYAGRMFTLPWFQLPPERRGPPKIDIKGLENKRRDNCEFLLDIANGMFECVLHRRDKAGAIAVVREAVDATLTGTVPLEKLVITKGLSKSEYDAKKAPQEHIIVAQRRAREDPGASIKPGERVPYVVCEPVGSVVSKIIGERCFMPDEVAPRGRTPDMLHYLTHKISVPICKIAAMLELGSEPHQIFQHAIGQLSQRRSGLQTLDRFFTMNPQRALPPPPPPPPTAAAAAVETDDDAPRRRRRTTLTDFFRSS